MNSDPLLTFLAYSTELESESQERYSELADALRAHNNAAVADFFERMAEEASNHLAEVTLIAAGTDLPSIDPWEFDWPDAEGPETISYEAVHYRMSLREAMLLALANENAAEQFYRDYAQRSPNADVQRVATEFANEEVSHAQHLELLLQDVPVVSDLSRLDDDPPVIPE